MDNTAEGFIAVIGQWRRGTDLGKVPLPYVHAVDLAGGRAKVLSTFELPEDEHIPEGLEVVTGIDPRDPSHLQSAMGLIVPGGGDIDPAWYGKKPHPRTTAINHQRDTYELTLMNEALEADMPILTICHGMQLLNVLFGGTMDQHLADRHNLIEHDRDRPRADSAHICRIKPGSILEHIFGSQRVGVNSHHHQGLGAVAPVLEEIGWAEDSVLEAVVSRDHTWVVGVQWHPEAMAPVNSQQLKLFEDFLEASRRYAAERASQVA